MNNNQLLWRFCLVFWGVMMFFAIVRNTEVTREIIDNLPSGSEISSSDTVLEVDTVVYTTQGEIVSPEALFVFNIVDSLGIRFPYIVTAQAMEETGWLKCSGCSLDHNNIFGFLWKKKYLAFESIVDCCVYYRDWQNRHYKGGDYYEFLECVQKHTNGDCMPYAGEPNYITYVKQITNQIK